MTREDLKDNLVEVAGYSREDVEGMAPLEMLDAYLKYNGIIGYTEDILSAVKGAYEIGEGVFWDYDDWE